MKYIERKMNPSHVPRTMLSIFRSLYRSNTNFLPKQNKPYTLEKATDEERAVFLTLRIITMILLITLIVIHVKYMRVFRWELSVTGGVLVTCNIAVFGLILCTNTNQCKALQAYLLSTSAVFLMANAAGLWRRWREATELTRAVAELLGVLGVPVQRQIILKISLSAAAAIVLLIDLCLLPILAYVKLRNNIR